MVYRFIILSDEVDDFRRDILIDSESTFFELHNAILDSVGYTADQMTSFFICDEDWSREQEITLVEMDTSSEEDNYVMDNTHLSDFLEDEKQKLIYVFEYLTERSFFMELREIIPGKSLEKPECVKLAGEAPPQTTKFEEIPDASSGNTVGTVSDDSFFDDDNLDLDEYDEEELDNFLSDGNPFDY